MVTKVIIILEAGASAPTEVHHRQGEVESIGSEKSGQGYYQDKAEEEQLAY